MKTMLVIALMLTACGKKGDTVQQYFLEPEKEAPAVLDPSVVVKTITCDTSGIDSKLSGQGFCDLLKSKGWNASDLSVIDQGPSMMLNAIDVDYLYATDPTPAGAAPEVQFAFYWEGPQALLNEGLTPDAAYDLFAQYVKDRAAKGWKTGVLTMLTQLRLNDSRYWPSDELWRQRYGALILENSAGADIVVNLDTDVRLSNCNNVTYFDDDKLHLAKAGVAAVYEMVQAALTDAGYISKSELEGIVH